MTLVEAAKLLELSPSTLRVQIGRGRLKATKVGRDWHVTRREVELYRREKQGRLFGRDAPPAEGEPED